MIGVAGPQAEFEQRLARSRAYNRPRYLRIKAIALTEVANLDAAEALLRRVVDDYPDALDVAFALELTLTFGFGEETQPVPSSYIAASSRCAPTSTQPPEWCRLSLAKFAPPSTERVLLPRFGLCWRIQTCSAFSTRRSSEHSRSAPELPKPQGTAPCNNPKRVEPSTYSRLPRSSRGTPTSEFLV